MENKTTVNIGDQAEDFTLKDQNKNEFKLFENKGKKVLLSFHPLAWTSICAQQMKSLEENKEAFDSLNTIAVGLSVDSVPCKNAWAESLGIKDTQLLSDFWPHGAVAKQFGLFKGDAGISNRANVIVDENDKIVFVKVYEIKTLPDINEIIEFLKNME
jgi:peroxiredoxin